jgi:hypothetical protein
MNVTTRMPQSHQEMLEMRGRPDEARQFTANNEGYKIRYGVQESPKEQIKQLTIDDCVFDDNGTAYVFSCELLNLRFIFTQLRQHKTSSDLTCQLLIAHLKPASTVHYQNLNLMAATTRVALSKAIHDKLKDVARIYQVVNWENTIDTICYKVIQTFTAGEPVQEIWGDLEDPEAIKAKYLIEPLLYEGESNVFFGPGENGKSYLALLLCVLVKLPYSDNPFGLKVKAANPLYLDYERSEKSFKARLTAICKGLGVAAVPIAYRRCYIPIADDIDNLLRIIKEGKYDLVVVDSVGIACAGELNSSETATRFAAALHTLPVTSLLITHTSKTEEGKKTPIGSVYFTTAPSNIFEVKKAQENGNSMADIALIHYKCNLGAKLHPLGFRYEFMPDRTLITRNDAISFTAPADNMTLKARIVNLLVSNGPMTTTEIAGGAGITESTTRTTCNRYSDTFTRQGDKWTLTSK